MWNSKLTMHSDIGMWICIGIFCDLVCNLQFIQHQRLVTSGGNIEKAMWVFNCLCRPGWFGQNWKLYKSWVSSHLVYLFRSKKANAHKMSFVCQSISILFIVLRIYNSDTNLKVFIHSFLKRMSSSHEYWAGMWEQYVSCWKNPNSNAINHHWQQQ